MPNPKGSKLLYLPPEIMEKFKGITSNDLQILLRDMDIWTSHITLDKDTSKMLKDRSDLEIVLKKFKVI